MSLKKRQYASNSIGTRVSFKIYRKTETEATKAPVIINEEVNCRIQKDHCNRIVE